MDFGDDLFDVFSEKPSTSKRKGDLNSNNASKKMKSAETKADSTTPQSLSSSSSSSSTSSALQDANKAFAEYSDQKVVPGEFGVGVKTCVTEKCYPPDWDMSIPAKVPPPGRKPAKEYAFALDPFQQMAVDCIEREESVLVSAHTSAGKTVVAEYAIAVALRDGQRVIYTSPIKALSNQKYRELHEEFGDVGLMTGDITINPSASCLVMTTEILRNMLYRGSEIMREVSWVVFDEVHYMNDRNRGVVWEETMILLPDTVKFVFLSATIPNATEFALWISKLHNHPCSVVYTEFRPTPLQHYVFPYGGDGLYLVVDDKGAFREANFQKALAQLKPEDPGAKTTKGKGNKRKGKSSGPSDIEKIVKLIMERQYQPAIVFSFSKKDVEANAMAMAALDFSDVEEKKIIEEIFNNAIDSLSEDDKKLPQVGNILPLLRRGIGLHHSGLLPILKEVIEILFQEGLIKVLFSTETFAMGLNMPAKTVVFTSVKKFDGENFRVVNSGEYIQMSGRAGRRGLDDRGIVILMMDDQIEPPVAKDMIKGEANRLSSSFNIGYNMLLNLLRVEEADPEYMMVRSFYQFQCNRKAPQLIAKLQAAEQFRDSLQLADPGYEEYYRIKQHLRTSKAKVREVINSPLHVLPFLNAGRVVEVTDKEEGDWGLGIVVNLQKKKIPKKSVGSSSSSAADAELVSDFVVDVLLNCEVAAGHGKSDLTSSARPCPFGQRGEMRVVPVLLGKLSSISSLRLYIPKDLVPKSARQATGKKLSEVKTRFPKGIPMLDPVEDMKIKDEDFLKLMLKADKCQSRLDGHPLKDSEILNEQLGIVDQKMQHEQEIAALKLELKNTAQDVMLRQTLKSMKRVLRKLGHTDSNNVIQLKGRVACEISTADELLATELMLSGMFSELEVEQLVALVSCLVCDEKSEEKVNLREDLEGALRQLQESARKIAQVILDCRLPIEVEEYVDKFKPHMMDLVYRWCKGAKFVDICKMTNIFEGTIIRVMRRLEELLRQFAAAAKSIGNDQLEAKFNLGIQKLKRDIVFAASLYL